MVSKNFKRKLYDIFSKQRGEYLNDYLYLKTLTYHKKISKKYFSVFRNIFQRLKNFNKNNYKGNLALRNFANKLMNIKYLGKYLYIFHYFHLQIFF